MATTAAVVYAVFVRAIRVVNLDNVFRHALQIVPSRTVVMMAAVTPVEAARRA